MYLDLTQSGIIFGGRFSCVLSLHNSQWLGHKRDEFVNAPIKFIEELHSKMKQLRWNIIPNEPFRFNHSKVFPIFKEIASIEDLSNLLSGDQAAKKYVRAVERAIQRRDRLNLTNPSGNYLEIVTQSEENEIYEIAQSLSQESFNTIKKIFDREKLKPQLYDLLAGIVELTDFLDKYSQNFGKQVKKIAKKFEAQKQEFYVSLVSALLTEITGMIVAFTFGIIQPGKLPPTVSKDISRLKFWNKKLGRITLIITLLEQLIKAMKLRKEVADDLILLQTGMDMYFMMEGRLNKANAEFDQLNQAVGLTQKELSDMLKSLGKK